MKKWLIVVLVLVGILIIASGIIFWRLNPPTVPAQLMYGSGEVTVNGLSVSGDQRLHQGDVVATTNGDATVILHESVFVNLEPNTEVTITDLDKQHPKAEQKGATSTTFAHASTVKEFSMRQGDETYVAKGTFFTVDEIKIFVLLGFVTIRRGDIFIDVTEEEISSFNSVTNMRETHKPTASELAAIRESLINARDVLKKQRQAEIDKSPESMALVKKFTGMTEEQLYAELEKYDYKSPADVSALLEKVPVETKSMNKVAIYTQEIQMLNKYIK